MHILLDEEIPDSDNIFNKLWSLCGMQSTMFNEEEAKVRRFLVSHIYQSMFGDSCDTQTIENILEVNIFVANLTGIMKFF